MNKRTAGAWLIVASLLICAGCKNTGTSPNQETPAPPNTPPRIIEFYPMTDQALLYRPWYVQYRVLDDSGISTLRFIINPDTTVIDTLRPPPTVVQGRQYHAFTKAGAYQVLLIATDAGGLADTMSASLTVLENQPPVVTLSSVRFGEGSYGAFAIHDVAYDPEGRLDMLDPYSFSAYLDFEVTADSLFVRPTDGDVNGPKSFILYAVDKEGGSAGNVVLVDIYPRDDISGRVHDALEGSYIAGVSPSLVMQGPYTPSSYVIVDGVPVTLMADGTYRIANLDNHEHILTAFLTNGTDSSFVRTFTLPARDQSFDPELHTNAGTSLALGQLWEFYDRANFSIGGKLGGIDFDHAADYTYYLPRKDTLGEPGLSIDEQATLEMWLTGDLLALLPATKRPAVVRGGEASPLPLRPGGMVPAIGYGLVWKTLPPGPDGEIATYDEAPMDGIPESAVIHLLYDPVNVPATGFAKSAALREFLSWMCAPAGPVTGDDLQYATVLHASGRASDLTGCDQKLLWLKVMHATGTARSTLMGMP